MKATLPAHVGYVRLVADRSLRDRKKALLLDVDARLESVWPGPVRTRRNADGISWVVALPAGLEAHVHLATIKDHLPVGEFAVHPTLIVRGGPVETQRVPRLGAQLVSQVREGRGVMASTDGLDALAEWVVRTVRDQFVPEMLECAAQLGR